MLNGFKVIPWMTPMPTLPWSEQDNPAFDISFVKKIFLRNKDRRKLNWRNIVSLIKKRQGEIIVYFYKHLSSEIKSREYSHRNGGPDDLIRNKHCKKLRLKFRTKKNTVLIFTLKSIEGVITLPFNVIIICTKPSPVKSIFPTLSKSTNLWVFKAAGHVWKIMWKP